MTFELINSTPFVPFSFESIEAKRQLFAVIVVRGTFDIIPGQRLALSPRQELLELEDQYHGEPGKSSLRTESSLAPYKPKTDVLIEATAYAPTAKPTSQWTAGIRVGPVQSDFRVTGPREWVRRRGFLKLSDIEPISSLDIRYESAFGGASDGDERRVFAENPVGCGFGAGRGAASLRCPQILPLDVETPRPGELVRPVGLGPLSPSWQPRVGRAGTHDELWARTQAPYPPDDFSFEFYNAAAPGLTFPGFARGDEIIQLTNLTPEGTLTCGLPQINMLTLVQLADSRLFPGPMNLDTIDLRPETRRAYLEWRGILPANLPLRRVEIRMSAPAYLVENN